MRAGSGFFLGAYLAIASDALFTLTGKKRMKARDQTGRHFSLVLMRW